MHRKIPEILRELREDSDLTQKEVGRAIGKTQQSCFKYENGIHALPLEIAVKLADLYNVSLDYLTGRTYDRFGVKDVSEIGKNLVQGYSYKQMLLDVAALTAEQKIQFKELIEFFKSKKGKK